MGILQQIREKLGAGSEMSESAAGTKALGERIQEANDIDEKIRALEQRLPLDEIQSHDLGEASSRELADLKDQRDRIAATCALLRREIADAVERERIAEKISKFGAAAEKARVCAPLAADLIAAIKPAVAAARALLDANAEFIKAIPTADAYMYGLTFERERNGIAAASHVHQLIVRALETPQRLEDEIGRSIETCTRNLAELRRQGAPETPRENEAASSSAASKEKSKRGAKAA
jgi:hypothetical protein